MQSLDLINSNDISTNKVQFLKPRELFYLRLNSLKCTPENLQLIKSACTYTSNVMICIPAEDFSNDRLRQEFLEMGVKGFAIRVTHQVQKWLKHQGFGQFNAGDRDIIQQYHIYKHLLPEGKDLVVEFQIGSDTRILAPTISGLYEMGIKFVVLNVIGQPDTQRCLQFREVFEYLKIRSCNRLNIYFPFWNNFFSEWDIKTQNTFSGLEHVHIDISNRCTHSCVFCGLYGPEAIEDMKQRSGGSIPKLMQNYMKMEIDTQKCMNIIESLPWSVKNIQFGGIGDPLMHESAVEFISYARSRGFAVEVLSNMEYLSDDDVNELHKLGGTRILDMHFIANISGGTPEEYIKTRPKQTEKSFYKVIHNLTRFTELRRKNNNEGVFFTLMCVVSKYNCHTLLSVAKLAHEIGAVRLWFKPMEIHGEVHEKIVPKDDHMQGMAKSLREAIDYADKNNLEVFQRDYCEAIIKKFLGDTIDV